MPRSITLGDIARKADVSLSTVSLAMRNSPKLRPETCTYIQKVAAEIGYVPDAGLAALVAYRKGIHAASYQSTLAWLDNWPTPGALRNIKTFNDYFLGAASRAEGFGYKLEEFFLREPNLSPSRMISILRARNIQGIIVPPQQYDGDKLDFDFTGFSAVALGYSLRPTSLHTVTNHQFRSITLLVTKLLSLGYKRVGLYLATDWDKKVNYAYTTGFTTAQNDLPEEDHIRPFLTKKVITCEEFGSWVAKERLDAVITQGISLTLLEWVKALGSRVPRDLAITDLNAHPDEPRVAGIYQNDPRIGAAAVDVVVSQMQRNERGLPETIHHTLIDGVWQPGESVRSKS
jgi:DNA-binding LacI/PurR family transcriptional regulator